MSKMIHILLLVMCLVTIITGHRDHGMQSGLKEDLELERQLNILNKPPIKSIHVFFTQFIGGFNWFNLTFLSDNFIFISFW